MDFQKCFIQKNKKFNMPHIENLSSTSSIDNKENRPPQRVNGRPPLHDGQVRGNAALRRGVRKGLRDITNLR